MHSDVRAKTNILVITYGSDAWVQSAWDSCGDGHAERGTADSRRRGGSLGSAPNAALERDSSDS